MNVEVVEKERDLVDIISPRHGAGRRLFFCDWLSGAVLVAALLIAALSAWHMWAFWMDECDSVVMAQKPLPELWAHLRYDSFPLAHPLLVKLCLQLTPFLAPEISLRLLGFGLWGGTVLAVWRFSLQNGDGSALLLFGLFCMAPMVTRYAETMRPYGLAALTLVLLAGQAMAYLRTGKRLHFWGALAWGFVALHTHYYNVIPVLGVAVAATVAGGPVRRRGSVLLACGLGLAATTMLIYLPALRWADYWVSMTKMPGRDFLHVLNGLNRLAGQLFSGFAPLWWLAGAGSLVWLIRAVLVSPRDSERRVVAAFAMVAGWGSLLVLVLAMYAMGNYVSPWYYLPTLALLVCCSEPVFEWSQLKGSIRPLFSVAVLTCVVGHLWAAGAYLRQPQSTMDEVGATLERLAGPGDLIMVFGVGPGVSFNYYYQGQAAWQTIPPINDHSIFRYDLLRQQVEGPNPLEPMLTRMEQTLQRGHTVFYVGELMNASEYVPADEPGASIVQQFTTRITGWHNAVTTYLTTRPDKIRHVRTTAAIQPNFEDVPIYECRGIRGAVQRP